MTVEVKVYSDLDAVAADAAGALDRAAQPSLFDRLDWFRLILAHCPPAGEPIIIRAQEKGASAWLFLSRQGSSASPMASWYSLRAGPIISGSMEALIHSELFFYIFLATRNELGLARLTLGPMASGPAELCVAAAKVAGWKASEARTTGWSLDLQGRDFAHYWASRPARLRSTVERQTRRAALDIRIHPVFDPDAWSAYESVYARSWKPAEGSPAFLRALAEAEGMAGTLRLGIASRAGEAVAAQFWLVENGLATIHKLAHVEEHRELSPGTLLSAAMFREAIDVDRVSRIDFGLGDEPYKADWMEERRPLRRLALFNPARVAGLTGLARTRAGQLVDAVRSR